MEMDSRQLALLEMKPVDYDLVETEYPFIEVIIPLNSKRIISCLNSYKEGTNLVIETSEGYCVIGKIKLSDVVNYDMFKFFLHRSNDIVIPLDTEFFKKVLLNDSII